MLRLAWGFSRHHLINHLIMSSARETNMPSQDADGLMDKSDLKVLPCIDTYYQHIIYIHKCMIYNILYVYIILFHLKKHDIWLLTRRNTPFQRKSEKLSDSPMISQGQIVKSTVTNLPKQKRFKHTILRGCTSKLWFRAAYDALGTLAVRIFDASHISCQKSEVMIQIWKRI